jgi:hypothetical protein
MPLSAMSSLLSWSLVVLFVVSAGTVMLCLVRLRDLLSVLFFYSFDLSPMCNGTYVCCSALRGLYDPALGPLEIGALCATCRLSSDDCPGHCGHIEMVVPVYNPVLFPQMFNILKRKCFLCHKYA